MLQLLLPRRLGRPVHVGQGRRRRAGRPGRVRRPTIVGILRGAPETLGIKPTDVDSTYLIDRSERDETAPPGAIDLAVYVSSDFGSGYIELNPDGSVKQINYPSN